MNILEDIRITQTEVIKKIMIEADQKRTQIN
jgi:hypothetical protein